MSTRGKKSPKKVPPIIDEEYDRRHSAPHRRSNNKSPTLIAKGTNSVGRRWTDPTKTKTGLRLKSRIPFNTDDAANGNNSTSTSQGRMTSRSAKQDSRRFQIEPKEITFYIPVNKSVDAAEPLKVMNYCCHPIYFSSKSTAVDLRPEPPAGIIKAFDVADLSILHIASKVFKSSQEKKTRNRITLEWVAIPTEYQLDLKKAVAYRDNVAPEDRFRHSFYVNYVIQQKNDVAVEMVERCRAAFFLPEHVILAGDFEVNDVSTSFNLTNETDCNVIWHFGELHNVLLNIYPKNGILGAKESQTITLTTKQFHVGNVSKISDHLVIEWTAAIDDLKHYSDVALEDAPKIFKYLIKVTYRYVKQSKHS